MELALLQPGKSGAGDRWRQHALLRAYALALLRREGEREAGRSAHAAWYAGQMRAADDEQRYYQMLPEIEQLRHAFAWAIDNHLAQAQDMIVGSFELMTGFGFTGRAPRLVPAGAGGGAGAGR